MKLKLPPPPPVHTMVPPVDTGVFERSLVRIPGSGHDRSAGSVQLDLSYVSTLAASAPRIPQTLPQALLSQRPENHDASVQSKLGSKTATEIGAARLTPQVSNNRGRKRSLNDTSVDSVSETPSSILSPTTARALTSQNPLNGRASTGQSLSSETASTSQTPPSGATLGNQTSSVESAISNQPPSQSSPVKRTRIVYMTAEEVVRCPNLKVINTTSGPKLCLPLQRNNTSSSITQLLQERNNLRQQNVQLQQRLALFQQLFRNRERLTYVVNNFGVKIPNS